MLSQLMQAFYQPIIKILRLRKLQHTNMSKKRRREQPAVNTRLVEIYEDLANVDENIRLKAAQALLTNFVANENSTPEQLNEILRRLFRGLCSGRKAARLGFSVVLTEVLTELLGRSVFGVAGVQDTLEVVETLKVQSQVSSSVSGQVCSAPTKQCVSDC